MGFYKDGKFIGADAKSVVSELSETQIKVLALEYLMKSCVKEMLAQMIVTGNVGTPRTIAEKALHHVKDTSNSRCEMIYGGISWRDEPKAPTKKAPAKKTSAKKKSNGMSPELMDLARELNDVTFEQSPFDYRDMYGDYPSTKALKECMDDLNDPEMLEVYGDSIQWLIEGMNTNEKEYPRYVALLERIEARLEEIQPSGSKKSSRSSTRKPSGSRNVKRTAKKPSKTATRRRRWERTTSDTRTRPRPA